MPIDRLSMIAAPPRIDQRCAELRFAGDMHPPVVSSALMPQTATGFSRADVCRALQPAQSLFAFTRREWTR
jgi:hypothetical protein